jgi:hypothetical protein
MTLVLLLLLLLPFLVGCNIICPEQASRTKKADNDNTFNQLNIKPNVTRSEIMNSGITILNISGPE